jgi:hypothetical protein
MNKLLFFPVANIRENFKINLNLKKFNKQIIKTDV